MACVQLRSSLVDPCLQGEEHFRHRRGTVLCLTSLSQKAEHSEKQFKEGLALRLAPRLPPYSSNQIKKLLRCLCRAPGSPTAPAAASSRLRACVGAKAGPQTRGPDMGCAGRPRIRRIFLMTGLQQLQLRGEVPGFKSAFDRVLQAWCPLAYPHSSEFCSNPALMQAVPKQQQTCQQQHVAKQSHLHRQLLGSCSDLTPA